MLVLVGYLECRVYGNASVFSGIICYLGSLDTSYWAVTPQTLAQNKTKSIARRLYPRVRGSKSQHPTLVVDCFNIH